MRAFAKAQASRLQTLLAQREAGAMLISVMLAVLLTANVYQGGLSA